MATKFARPLLVAISFLAFAGCNSNSRLSGSMTNSSSSEPSQSVSCSFNGQLIADGQSITVYTAQSVPFGSPCSSVSQKITCTNGELPVGIFYPSCSVAAPAACSFNNQSIASGSSVSAFQSASVPYGQSCQPQSRTCENGVLSGTYLYATCAVGQPASCVFNGQTVASGGSIGVYSSQTVPYGSACSSVSQTITCSNGSFSPSGTYYPSCSVTPPASCFFDGQTIASGASVTAYQNSSAPNGQKCVSQARTCSNGTLSGTYAYASCSVAAPTPIPTPAPTPSRVVPILATANSNIGISKVEFYINGVLTCTETTPSSGSTYTCNWTVPVGAGVSYSLRTDAYDTKGNIGTSKTVQVTSD